MSVSGHGVCPHCLFDNTGGIGVARLEWRAMLLSRTSSDWVELACSRIDLVLVDHAHCEKKAAASALSLIAAYPSDDALVRAMSALAVEELQHFRAVHEHIVARGLSLGRDGGDPYAQQLLSLASADERRLVDRLLLLGLIEARSHERLELLGEHLDDPALSVFYKKLAEAESRHAAMFVELAGRYAAPDDVRERLHTLATEEARIVAALPVVARVH